MKRQLYILAVTSCLLFGIAPASAQTHEDIYKFSQYNWSYGTARSAAMGGAFSALGADLSATMLNPAGLGMYRRSELAISPGFFSLGTETQGGGRDAGFLNTTGNQSKMTLGNIGGAFNLYTGSGALTSFTFGFSYNKLIDHNAQTYARGTANVSMADMFTLQLNDQRMYPNSVQSSLERGHNYGLLGAMLAQQTWMIEFDDDPGILQYHLFNTLTGDAVSNFNMRKETSGSTGQYDISMGMNFSNIIYFGLGFGMQDIYYKETNEYGERISNNEFQGDDYALKDFTYIQRLTQNGSAWNFKIGAIIRPVEELRIGLTYHTPTYITIDEQYGGNMRTHLNSSTGHEYYNAATIEGTYYMHSPGRFIGGLSYTLNNRAILSVDYERIWYNKMKFFWDSIRNGEDTDIRGQVNDLYQASDNVRVGLEVLAVPNLFVRAGFAYYGGMFKDALISGYDGRTLNYSGGVGYRTANWGIDLAYVYMHAQEPGARIFEYSPYNYAQGNDPVYSGLYKTDRNRHNVILTASWRF